ncbi:hypothetical protein J6590_024225 [Homalodisca vitripennis]|nr:hypothetical protein J6590_024225 [Homalodisca vitripennis]
MNKADLDCITTDGLTCRDKSLNKKVADLVQRIDDMEQYSRANAKEIQGIPVHPNEEVVSVVKEVGKAVVRTVTDSKIDACHRLGNKVDHYSPPRHCLASSSTEPAYQTHEHANGPDSVRQRGLDTGEEEAIGGGTADQEDKDFFLRKDDGTNVMQVTCQAELSKLQLIFLKKENKIIVDPYVIHADITDHSMVWVSGAGVWRAGRGSGEPVMFLLRCRTDYTRLDQLLDSADSSLVYNQANVFLAFDEFL